MPDLNLANKIGKEDYAKHEGEVFSKGGTQYKVISKEENYVANPDSEKSTNLFKGTNNDYLNLISKNKAYYNEDGSAKSAQQINMLTGINKIHPDKFQEYNKLVGYTPEKEIVFTDGGVDREIETNITNDGGSSTGDIPEKEYTYSVTGGESKTIETSNKKGDSKKRLFKRKNNQDFKNNKVESKTGKFCVNPDDSTCDMDVAKLQGASDKADDKAYKKAQKDRSYRVKKDGTQVLKKQFAPGEWFSEKMESHRINKAKNQGQSSRRREQRQIAKDRKARNRANSREHQHNNPQNYNKVSNFFNELSYKKDKPKKRIVKASF